MVDLFSVSNLTLEDRLETKPLRGWKQSGAFVSLPGWVPGWRPGPQGGAGRGGACAACDVFCPSHLWYVIHPQDGSREATILAAQLRPAE